MTGVQGCFFSAEFLYRFFLLRALLSRDMEVQRRANGIARVYGFVEGAISELLQSAEAGLIEVMNERNAG